MNWLGKIAREIFGLFVDDGALAVAILGWLALTFLLSVLKWPADLICIVLFAGLGLLFFVSTARRAIARCRPGSR